MTSAPLITRRALAALLLTLMVAESGCKREPATAEDCGQILDRMVMIELSAQGYRDPALLQRSQTDARARYERELSSCVGRELPPGAMECVARAGDIETLIHKCLHPAGAHSWSPRVP